MSIFDHVSMRTSSWLLDTQRITVELCLSHRFMISSSNPMPLGDMEKKLLNRIPKTVATTTAWLNVDPPLTTMTCCSKCFALYPETLTPRHCNHLVFGISGGSHNTSDPNTEIRLSSLTEEEAEFTKAVCGQPLLKHVRGKEVPISKYSFQNLSDWIARLLSRPRVELWLDESLSESSKPFSTIEKVSDIHQLRAWKAFCGPDGRQFTAVSGNLTFAMFVDAINPYGNKMSGKHASITFVVLVCLTLPIRVRYQPEHIYLAGIVPGPREPSLEQINWVLRPVVTQLKELWNPGLLLSQTHLYTKGRLIRAALLPFVADIPALRRCLGFPSATARNFCSMCHLIKSHVTLLKPELWPPRTCQQHKVWAQQALNAKTIDERKDIFKTHGVRYSVLVELEYWDIINYHVVDSMHNLLLGLLSWHLCRFWSMSDVKNEEENLPYISTTELWNLMDEHTRPLPTKTYASNITKDKDDDDDEQAQMPEDTSFSNNTSTSDEDFDPLNADGWNGKWEAPPFEEVIFDAQMLQKINSLLPQIRIPSWVKRAIPVLGKASFGKLKADEWRNLFCIQLPLTLIPIWSGKDHVKNSLLQNFCHLVSLVNLALKRSVTEDHISQYSYHIQKYLEGSLVLFEHCNLAPNHHMAIHLADCLERFGPVRAWWSFVFERLMGSILQGCHNNHLGTWVFCVTFFAFGGQLHQLTN